MSLKRVKENQAKPFCLLPPHFSFLFTLFPTLWKFHLLWQSGRHLLEGHGGQRDRLLRAVCTQNVGKTSATSSHHPLALQRKHQGISLSHVFEMLWRTQLSRLGEGRRTGLGQARGWMGASGGMGTSLGQPCQNREWAPTGKESLLRSRVQRFVWLGPFRSWEGV